MVFILINLFKNLCLSLIVIISVGSCLRYFIYLFLYHLKTLSIIRFCYNSTRFTILDFENKRNIMKKIFCIVLMLIGVMLSSETHAQYINTGFWSGVELDYGLSPSDKGNSFNKHYGKGARMQMASVRTILGYYIVPSFSLGMGAGFSTYSKSRVNAVPIFLDCRIHPLAKRNENFYINLNLGTFLGDNQSHIESKSYWEASIGYKLFDFGGCNLAPAFGFQHYRYKIDHFDALTEATSMKAQNRRTWFLRLSLTY